MILSKEKYYKRRWFSTILFLLASLLVVYAGINVFRYNKSKQELNYSIRVPFKLSVKSSTNHESKIITLTRVTNKQKVSSLVKNSGLEKLVATLTGNGLVIPNPTAFEVSSRDLQNIDFEYWYWKDRLYEFKVHGHRIVSFEEREPTFGYVLLSIGLVWFSFQLWTISILIRKGDKIYEDALKKKEV